MNRRWTAFLTAMLRSTEPAPQSLTRPTRPETKASLDLESSAERKRTLSNCLCASWETVVDLTWRSSFTNWSLLASAKHQVNLHSLIHPTGNFRNDSRFALLSRHFVNSSTDGAASFLQVPDPLRARCASLWSCRTSVVFLPCAVPFLNTPSKTLQTLQNACSSVPTGVLELADGDTMLTLSATEVEAARSESTRLSSTIGCHDNQSNLVAHFSNAGPAENIALNPLSDLIMLWYYCFFNCRLTDFIIIFMFCIYLKISFDLSWKISFALKDFKGQDLEWWKNDVVVSPLKTLFYPKYSAAKQLTDRPVTSNTFLWLTVTESVAMVPAMKPALRRDVWPSSNWTNI